MDYTEDEEIALMHKVDQAACECFADLWPESFALLKAFIVAGYSPATIEDTLRPLWKDYPFFRFVRPTAEFLERKTLEDLRQSAKAAFNELPFMRGNQNQ